MAPRMTTSRWTAVAAVAMAAAVIAYLMLDRRAHIGAQSKRGLDEVGEDIDRSAWVAKEPVFAVADELRSEPGTSSNRYDVRHHRFDQGDGPSLDLRC